MHKVAQPIEQAASVPFIHIGDVTREAIEAAGFGRAISASSSGSSTPGPRRWCWVVPRSDC
ncbi:hypothetical protein [Spiribacter insolitus]|uniref:hypothetical protein n=1 Tax=Spiribacter insolitus TaxID=3122417 RepID=UPI0038B5056E